MDPPYLIRYGPSLKRFFSPGSAPMSRQILKAPRRVARVDEICARDGVIAGGWISNLRPRFALLGFLKRGNRLAPKSRIPSWRTMPLKVASSRSNGGLGGQ